MGAVMSLADRRHSKRLSVDLTENQHRDLRLLAMANDLSVSHSIRALVELFTENEHVRELALERGHQIKDEDRNAS